MKEYYIYEIKNTLNDKYYIGQSSRCDERSLKEYYGSGKIIIRAIKKYGIENFTKTVLVRGFYEKSEIDKLEKFYIKKYRDEGKNMYNIADGGQGGDLGVGYLLGHPGDKNPAKRPEVREKISNSNKGKKRPWLAHPRSEEEKRKISEGTKKAMQKVDMKEVAKRTNRNTEAVKEGRKKVSETLKKFYKDHPERKIAIGERQKGKNNPMYGVPPKIKGMHWYNNGIEEKILPECPEGWVPGRLKS